MHRQGEDGGDGDVDTSGYWEQRTVYIDMLAAQKFVPRGSSPGADRRFFQAGLPDLEGSLDCLVAVGPAVGLCPACSPSAEASTSVRNEKQDTRK
jgi:hypothetical protein